MAGSAEEAVARAYATAVLEKCGFAVSEEPFDFSRFPSRFASPLGALLISATVVAAARFGSHSDPRLAAATLLAGLLLTVIFAGAMLGDAVLWLPFLRGTSRNLVATPRNGPARLWLVAHPDTQSQPVPSALRVAGIVMLG